MPARAGLADRAGFALVVIALLGVLYALVARFALDAFPYSGDEYSLSLQAELFAHGELAAPAPAHAEWLRVDHVVLDDTIRSKYPPGAAALLAIGAAAGAPWLVTPIEAVLALLVVWLTVRRLSGEREALIAVLAVGLAPLFSFQAATFYAHTATVLFLAIAFAGVAGWLATERTAWLVLAGAGVGMAFVTRPVDGALFGLAMLALRSPRAVIVTALAALPFALVHFAYQAAQFGSPLTDGYHAYEPTLRAIYGTEIARSPVSPRYLFDPVQQWNHLDVFRAFVVEWTVPGAILLAVFGAFAIGRDHPQRRLRTFALALIATYAGVLMFTVADPDDGARARYLSPLLVPLGYLAAAGFAPAAQALAARFGRRVRAIVIATAVVFSLGQLAAILYARLPLQWTREGLYQAAADAHLRDAVVIVRAQYPTRYARNGPFFAGVLYLSPPPTVGADAIAAAYPGRAVWEAREGTPWTLTRVR